MYNKNKEKIESMNQESINDEVYQSSIMIGNTQRKEEDIARSKTESNIKDKSQIPNNNKNISIIFVVGRSKKIIIQAQNDMSINSFS